MRMLLFFLLTCCNLSISLAGAQPPGTDDSIMNIKTKWKKIAGTDIPDPSIPKNSYPLIHKKLEQVAGCFKQAYPVPTGTEASWYGNIRQAPIYKDAPAPYSFWSLYKFYYYNKNYKKIILGDETGTWAYVFVNYFNWLLVYAGLDASINGLSKKIWQLPKQLPGDWQGYTVYEPYTHPNARAVVITKDGKRPWKALTRLEYLQALRAKREAESSKMSSDFDAGIAKSRQLIEDIRNRKNLSPDIKNKMIAASQEQLEKMIVSRENLVKTVTIQLDKDLAVIDAYLKSHSASELEAPAVLNRFKDFLYHKRFEDPGHKDAAPLAYIDQVYFNKAVPAYEPQFMVLYWRWNDNAPGNYFNQQIQANFPLEKLKAMLKN
ncbi:MAG: hypothetical protein H7Y01_10890 [Ferruginibacter sp.]|nr:hypothetical protein [Chitinophagaceae bacterium]